MSVAFCDRIILKRNFREALRFQTLFNLWRLKRFIWERDVLLAHGASNFLRDRLLFNSDFYRVHICSICGLIAQSDLETQRFLCKCQKPYNRTKIAQVMMPYAFKLLLQEMQSMCIATRLILDED